MSDYLKGKRVVDPVLTSIARGYKNAAFIGERIFPVVLTDKEGDACTDLRENRLCGI